MDDERSAVGVEDRVLTPGERYPVVRRRVAGAPVRVDGDVLEVAPMRPFGVVEPMLGARRVEVLPGGLEVRRNTTRLVDVNTVLPGLDGLLPRLQVGVNGHPVRTLRKGRVAHGVTVRILKLRRGGAPALRQRHTGTQGQ